MNRTFLTLIALNVFAVFCITFNYFQSGSSKNLRILKSETFLDMSYTDVFDLKKRPTDPNSPYQFEDPVIAYHLLQRLDIFENGQNNIPKGKEYDKMYFGTKINNDYCNDHRAFFAYNPEAIFNEKLNFMTDYWNHQFRNTTVPRLGNDLHPKIGRDMPKALRVAFFESLNPEAHIFFTYTQMSKYRLIGKQFSCLTQSSNHLAGNDTLNSKGLTSEALAKYSKNYRSRPQCLNNAKWFPETFILSNTEQCQKFFKLFNSPEYVKAKAAGNITYIRKIGDGSYAPGKGVFLVNGTEEQELRKLYSNGTKCGKITKSNIIQTYIPNLLKIEKNDFVFRVFLFMASTNPNMAYYHDGYLKISKEEKKVVKNKTIIQTTEENMFFDKFNKYMEKQKLVKDPKWMESHLRTQMKKVMVHLVRMTQDKNWKKSSTSEIFGIDFMMDSNLNLWFSKATSAPVLEGWDAESDMFFDKLLSDSIEISMGLLRSRTKRIIKYINDVIGEKGEWKYDGINFTLKNSNKRKEEFKELTKNHFEIEFEPSPTNGFVPIVDENLRDTHRYFEILEEKCL